MIPAPMDDGIPDEWNEFTSDRGFQQAGPRGKATSALKQMADAVWRWKWLALILAVIGGAVGYKTGQTVNPSYTAHSTVWIEGGRQRAAAELDPIGSAELLQSQAWLQLLTSFSVLEPVVLNHKLYVSSPDLERDAFESFRPTPDMQPGTYRITVSADGQSYTLADVRGTVVGSARFGQSVGESHGFSWSPPRDLFAPEQQTSIHLRTTRDASRALGERLQTRLAPDGTFLQISYRANNPLEAAGILNAVTDRYVEIAAELKRARLDELTVVLAEQLASAETNLREAEIALEGFRVQTITLPSDQTIAVAPGIQQTRDPAIETFFGMRVEREQARTDRESIERVLRQVQRGELTIDALAAIPAVQGSQELIGALNLRMERRAELRALQQRYTEDYPPVQRLLQEITRLEQNSIPQLAGALVSRLRVEEGQMETRLASAAGELQQIPPRAIEEARLQRQVTIAGSLFTTLKQRFEEARLAAESSIPEVRLLDHATVPYAPIASPMPSLMLGILGGLGLGAMIGIVFGRMDPKLRYPDQVMNEMGLPIIGAVGHVASGTRKAPLLARQAGEAFREIRLSVTSSFSPGQPILLTISSPESGDGKSFVSRNLGMSFARQRVRTLVVDGDIRRGHLHKRFGLSRTPGLTDVLMGTATLEEAIHPTDIPGLFILPSGRRTEMGPELLTSDELPKLLRRLEAAYGAVLIDTPPLGAGIDPYVFAVATRKLMLVMRSNRTNRVYAAAKLDLLDRLPIQLTGVVLNDVPPSKAYRYYSYLPGYEVEAEEDEAVAALGPAMAIAGD